ncbi:MAG: gamma-glutamyl-gamma-aminobutyrate hydrolase family protein [Pseudomonadota bacterium]
MKIGVLEAGPVNPKLSPRHGEYGAVFERYLSRYDEALTFEAWAVHAGEAPNSPEDADAWIISGSKYGVYDDMPFIEPLKALIREIVAAGRPLIGVCFGHQIMAEALNGRAEKSVKGWGLGRQVYDAEMPDWAPAAPPEIAINALHQDQVTKLPPDATCVASSEFCEYAALVYGDKNKPYAISIQPHPEFSDSFVGEIIEARSDVFSGELGETARASLGGELHRDWAAGWFLKFLETSMPKN